MIPYEAKEAALDAWGGCPVGASPKAQITRILEAAAPYLKAEAWDEGWDAGSSDETDSYWGPSAVTTPNPYRSQA